MLNYDLLFVSGLVPVYFMLFSSHYDKKNLVLITDTYSYLLNALAELDRLAYQMSQRGRIACNVRALY